MSPRWRRILALVMVASVWGCRGTALTPEEQSIVDRYLFCIECVAPLESVRALALRRPVATVDSLNSALVHGLNPRAVATADSLLRLGYVRDSSWRAARGLSPLVPRADYVARERARYADGYRARGAIALGWIHDPRAVRYLDEALLLHLPTAVRQPVIYARDSLPPP